MGDNNLSLITVGGQKTIETLYVDMKKWIDDQSAGIAYAINAAKVDTLYATNERIAEMETITKTNINTLFQETLKLKDYINKYAGITETEINNSKWQLQSEHRDINATIEESTKQTDSLISKISNSVGDGLIDTISDIDTELINISGNLSSGITDLNREISSNTDIIKYHINNTNNLLSNNIQTVNNDLSNITLTAAKNTVKDIDKSVKSAQTAVISELELITDDISSLPDTTMALLDELWRRIESFIVKQFSTSIENLVEIYVNQYKAKTIADRQLVAELGGQ